MDIEEARYTRVEYERRFLVSSDESWRNSVETYSKTFEDKYLSESRLRLRVLTDSDSERCVIKLNKKFESTSPYFRTVSRILLSPEEYQLLFRLEGDRLTKVRHYCNHLGRVFSIDVFSGELEGLVICETEADSLEELMSVEPPPYVTKEITNDSFFDGGNLCRTKREDLLRKLGEVASGD